MKPKFDKQQEADERQLVASKMTPQERLKELDARLGKNVGAARERTRLRQKIENQTN